MADSKKDLILKKYAQMAKKLKSEIHMSDLTKSGITKDMVKHHFGSLGTLDKDARMMYPECFFDLPLELIYSDENLNQLRKKIKSTKRFVLTTAVTGCEIHEPFYNSLKTYCKKKNAELLILVASDPAHGWAHGNKDWGSIDSKLVNENIILEDTKLNSNVFISTIKLSAKHIDPTTGLERIGQRNGTFIYASPKQRLRAIPVGNGKFPHFMMTTGAITKPNYTTDLYFSQRTAYIAENDHLLGALIVEIEDNEFFHFRQIQSNDNGMFVDLAVAYEGNKVSTYAPEAFVLGDWHSGETDPTAASAWFEVIEETKPKKVITHDTFNGLSINHHEEHKYLLKAKRAEKGQLSLENELKGLASDLTKFSQHLDEVVIVKSNHDAFLETYLQDGIYVKDPQNHKLALKLALHMLEGRDPLAEGVRPYMDKKAWDKIRWLKLDEDYIIAGVQCGAHGHNGSNGARGSLRAMEQAYQKSVSGHAHTPEILRNAYQVGTSSYLKLSYTKGASSWLHTSCLIYPNGQRQLINSINGKWRLK